MAIEMDFSTPSASELKFVRRFSGTDVFTDEDGNRADDMPVAHSEYQFTSAGNDTILSNVTRYASPAQRDQIIEMGVEAGVTQTLSRLDAYLASLA